MYLKFSFHIYFDITCSHPGLDPIFRVPERSTRLHIKRISFLEKNKAVIINTSLKCETCMYISFIKKEKNLTLFHLAFF